MQETLTEEQREVLERVWLLRPFVIGAWLRRGNICSAAVSSGSTREACPLGTEKRGKGE